MAIPPGLGTAAASSILRRRSSFYVLLLPFLWHSYTGQRILVAEGSRFAQEAHDLKREEDMSHGHHDSRREGRRG